MKIITKADGVSLRLWFPLSVLKSKLGYGIVNNMIEKDEIVKSENTLTREQIIEMYKALKQYVKANGHFNLVEIDTHDGEKILIRV